MGHLLWIIVNMTRFTGVQHRQTKHWLIIGLFEIRIHRHPMDVTKFYTLVLYLKQQLGIEKSCSVEKKEKEMKANEANVFRHR